MPEFLKRLMKQIVHRLIKVNLLRFAMLFLIVAVLVSMMIVITIDFLWDGRFNAELEFAGVITPLIDGLFLVIFVTAMLDHIRDEMVRRKQAEEDIRKYLDTVQIFMVALDAQGRIIMINRAGCELLGYEESELLGRNWFETCLPQSGESDKVFSVFQRILAGEQPSVEYYDSLVVCRDGRQRLIGWHSAARFDDKGHIVGTLGSGKDITESKQSEEALKNEALRRRVLMEGSQDGIAIINQQHQVVEANARFAEMLGYTSEEMLGLYIWDFEATMTEAEIRANFANLLNTSTIIETRHRRKDGTVYDVEVSIGSTMVGGEPMVFTISRDITARKLAESNLVEQLEELRRWHDTTLGREGRILELKHEVNDLLSQTGKHPRYQSAESPDPKEK
jgi:PAS domain S-box-containing protein